MTEAKEFFSTYCDFVTKVTSEPSLDIEELKKSLDEIQNNSTIDIPIPYPFSADLNAIFIKFFY